MRYGDVVLLAVCASGWKSPVSHHAGHRARG